MSLRIWGMLEDVCGHLNRSSRAVCENCGSDLSDSPDWGIYDDDEFDDDEEEKRSFGHHLIGAIKAILGVVLTLLVVVIILNVLYIAGHGSFLDKLNDRFGDSSAFKFLFFSYGMRQEEVVEPVQELTMAEAIGEIEEIEEPVEEVELVIPDLDANFDDADADIDFGSEEVSLEEAIVG